MKKVFLSNLILQLSLNLVIKPLYVFGVDLGIQNAIGKEAYGTYFSLLSFSYLLQMLNEFGIQNFTSSTIAKYPFLAQKYFSNLFTFKLILSTVYFGLTFGLAFVFGYDWPQIKLLLLIMILQIAASFLLFFRAIIAALGNFRTDSLLSVLDRVLLLVFGLSLLHLGFFQKGDDATLFAILQLSALSFAATISFFILRSRIGFTPFQFHSPTLKYLFKKGFPFALITFLMVVYTRIDVVLLERMLPDGQAQAGIYASGYRLIEALNSVLLIFGTLLLPMFSSMVARQESIKDLLQLSLKIVLFIGITAPILVYYFKYDISQLLYTEATPYWGEVMGVLFWSSIPLAGMYVLGALMTASGDMRRYNLISAAGVLISLVANVVVIPRFQAIGVAYVSIFTQFFIAATLLWSNMRFFGLRIDMKSTIQMLLFSGLLLLLVPFVRDISLPWGLQFMLLGAIAALLSLLTRLWSVGQLLGLLKK